MDVELLITEIGKRPVLWDVHDESYREKNKKNDGWMDVATVIFENFGEKTQAEQKVIIQDLISKWRSVRDNYIRSLKKQVERNKSGSRRKKIQRYIFEEQLSFLKKSRELRPTTSSVQSDLNEKNVDATRLPDDNIMAIGDESSIDDNINNAAKTVLIPPPIKKKKIDLEEKLALFLDSRQQSRDEPNRDTDDEDLSFYKSTLPIVKTLNMEQKIQYRIQLMQLLQRIVKTNQ